ncbi:DUF192 domain-containing protein [Candidatus Daviesbacteria bacterium]|nr:DUF192 domain-containing protein [Candidatus Daviesbacteria bacterium]
MQKFAFQMVAILIVLFGALWFLFKYQGQGLFNINTPGDLTASPSSSSDPFLSINKLQIVDAQASNFQNAKATVKVGIADTKEERAKGLGDRDRLDSDSGMIFIFEMADKHRFWMKGMKFPIDFIWINGDRVVDLLQNVTPPKVGEKDENLPRYEPVVSIDKVLEVPSGFIASHNIKVGDKIVFILNESPSPEPSQ